MIPTLLTDTVSYDLERAVHYTLLWGLQAVELRSVGGASDRVPFVNESKVKQRLAESELPVLAVDPGTFQGRVEDRAEWLNELAELDETLQFCRRIRCERVVVSCLRGDGAEAMATAADVLQRAAGRASALGIRLCVLNGAGSSAPDGRRLADLLKAVGTVDAAWSPADALIAGEDPADGLRALGDRVGLVRCRNGVPEGNGWEPRSIDSGEIDWPNQLRRLRDVAFRGPLSLEVESDPRGGLRDATALIKMIRDIRR